MPRLSQADAALVVRCLERVLEEGKVDSSIQDPRPVSQVLARLKTRLEQARAAPDPRPRPEAPFGSNQRHGRGVGRWSSPRGRSPRALRGL